MWGKDPTSQPMASQQITKGSAAIKSVGRQGARGKTRTPVLSQKTLVKTIWVWISSPFGYGFHLVGPEQQIFRQKLGNNKVMSSTCVFKAPFLSRGFEEGLTITAMPLNLSPSLQCCMPLSILLTVITVMSHTVSLPCLQPSCTSLLDVWTLNRGSQGPSPYGHCYSLAPHLSSSWSNFLRFLKGFVLFLVSRSSHALFLLPRTFFSRIPNPIPISKLQPIQNFLEGCMTQVFTPFPLGSAL